MKELISINGVNTHSERVVVVSFVDLIELTGHASVEDTVTSKQVIMKVCSDATGSDEILMYLLQMWTPQNIQKKFSVSPSLIALYTPLQLGLGQALSSLLTSVSL